MFSFVLSRRTAAVMLLSVATALPALGKAGPLPKCPAPVLQELPGYTAGNQVTIGWTAGTSGGFIVNSSLDGSTNPDGSWVNADPAQPGSGSVDAASRSYVFSGLSEGPHYYHVRAKKSASCAASDWSNIVFSIQDASGPQVFLSSPQSDENVVGLEGLTLAGTLVDPSAGAAPGSGPALVSITLTNTTEGISSLLPSEQVEADASSGNFTYTFRGLRAGSYRADLAGADVLGNTGPMTSVNFTVVTHG